MKLLVVDDHALVRNAMARYLSAVEPTYQILEAANGEEALALLNTQPVDLVLMDIQMPVMNGVEATQLIRNKFPHQRILILSQLDETALIIHLMRMGANGFVRKKDDINELQVAIEACMHDTLYISDAIAAEVQKYESAPDNFPTLSLSPREYQVLNLIVNGLSNREMAAALKLEVLTVESYRKSLMNKTKALNVADLVGFAFNIGLAPKNRP